MYTNDEQITELMKWAESGKIQLPDFQRGWVSCWCGYVFEIWK